MTKIKVCGFREASDALTAAEAGADYLGLVFVPSAGRRLSAEEAEALLAEFRQQWSRESSPKWVGLFGDQPAEEVVRITTRLGLDAVQLCGTEGMAYCAQMTVPVFKVIAIDTQVPASVVLPKLMVMIQRHSMAGHHPVLDTHVPGAYGGTGQAFDWALIRGLSQSFRFGLAGGLTEENVGRAIREVQPWGVDTSSGVESDGHKDPTRVRAFMKAVRETDDALAPKGLRALLRRGRP